ncbi:FMN-binding protein [Nocardia sp. R16R-3T]
MKRILWWVMSTITGGVLLFGYHTSTAGPLNTASPPAALSTSQPGPIPSAAGTTASGSAVPASDQSTTYTGSSAQTRWGPVQVTVTVSGGRVTEVTVPQSPNGNSRDKQINARALPVLVQETLEVQSAHIDMVSGATVTSDGYVRSLQAALDQAGL